MSNFLIRKSSEVDYSTSVSGKGSVNLYVKPNNKNLSLGTLKSQLKITYGDNVQYVTLIQDGLSSLWAYYLYIGDRNDPSTGVYTAPDIVFPSDYKYDIGNCQLDRFYEISSYRCKIINNEIDFSTKEELDLTFSELGDVGSAPNGLKVWELLDVRNEPDTFYGHYRLDVTTNPMDPDSIEPLEGSIIITQAESNKQLTFRVIQKGYYDKTEIEFNYYQKGDEPL